MTVRSFLTASGVEIPAISTEKMREVDRLAIEELGPNLYQMMENAGRSMALTVLDHLGSGWRSTPIVVLAGTGGNGGGGICAARHLANRGADVTVVISDFERLAPVPAEQLKVYLATEGNLATIDELAGLHPTIVVDAIVGYSLRGAPRGLSKRMIEWAAALTIPVIALDVPSGIDSTSGAAPGVHVMAEATMTLALPKTGLDVPAVGRLSVADLGIPGAVFRRVGIEGYTEVFGDGHRVALEPI